MTMIWHIFRKDVTLLWKEILIVALLNAGAIVMKLQQSSEIAHSGDLLSIAVSVVSAYVLLTKAVHLDAPVDHRLDWLVRPIRRRDLICAKLLFATIALLGPIMILDLIVPVAAGFPVMLVIKESVLHAIGLFIGLAVPMVAFASMASNIGEAILVPALLIPGAFLADNGIKFMPWFAAQFPSGWLGPSAAVNRLQLSIEELIAFGASGLAGILVLSVLYVSRNRWIGSIFVAAALVLIVGARPISRVVASGQLAYVQESASGVAFSFAPEQPRFISSTAYGYGTIHVPLSIAGLAQDESVYIESILAHVELPDGTKLEGYGGASGQVTGRYVYPPVHFNDQMWSGQSQQVVKLSLDVSFIVLVANGSYPVPWSGVQAQVPGVGLCRIVRPVFGQIGALNCLQVGSGVLPLDLDPPSLKFAREPWSPVFGARPIDLSNNPAGIFSPRSMMLTGAPNRSDPGAAVLRTYRVNRFRSAAVTIPQIRFADWDTAQTIR